jgi:hypothetical protein
MFSGAGAYSRGVVRNVSLWNVRPDADEGGESILDALKRTLTRDRRVCDSEF